MAIVQGVLLTAHGTEVAAKVRTLATAKVLSAMTTRKRSVDQTVPPITHVTGVAVRRSRRVLPTVPGREAQEMVLALRMLKAVLGTTIIQTTLIITIIAKPNMHSSDNRRKIMVLTESNQVHKTRCPLPRHAMCGAHYKCALHPFL